MQVLWRGRGRVKMGATEHREFRMARFLLLMNYGATLDCDIPMHEWAREDVDRHITFQHDLGRELTERGELVDAQGVAGPEAAKIVTYKGDGAPVVDSGPFPERREFLAGYWLVDATPERALEIAAKASAAPGPGGRPLGQPIEVREIMGAPDTSEL